MTNKPKAIGTAAETAVVRYLQANGWPNAERRALRGLLDAGDITGTPGVCWEVKARARPVSDQQVTNWLAETEGERLNSGENFGVLVIRRPGVGPANAGSWWAVLPARDMTYLLASGGDRVPGLSLVVMPVRLLLADAVRLLRWAGYGDPLPEVTP